MILGLGSRAGVGKDEVADYLVRSYGFKKRAFADALKEGVIAIFGLTRDQVYTFEGKQKQDSFWGVDPRYILQKVGTECLREVYDPDIWVKALHKYALNYPDDYNWVIPDTRFANECDAIREWNGELVCINRPGYMGEENMGIAGHASETSLDGYDEWDYIIENNGTLDQLYDRVDNMMEILGGSPI